MSLAFLLLIAALVCFFLALIGLAAKIDLTALGLLFWVIAVAMGAGGISLILLAIAAMSFLIALLKVSKPAINWIALGLALWVLATMVG